MEYFTGVITLQYIFSQYWLFYVKWYTGKIREAVIENVSKILMCRTSALGFHVFQCKECKEVRIIPHSCKSRFCSSCGKVSTDKWVAEKLSDILEVAYHHVIFTLPWQLRIICLANREVMLNIFFKAVNKSIQEWTLKHGKYLSGFFTVLHSFGSDIKFNPHFHVLITAGGLSVDKKKWVETKGDYLMPEKGLIV